MNNFVENYIRAINVCLGHRLVANTKKMYQWIFRETTLVEEFSLPSLTLNFVLLGIKNLSLILKRSDSMTATFGFNG